MTIALLGLWRGFFSHELPTASFILVSKRIRQALLQTQGVLHLRVRELDEDPVLRRSFRDHPLPLNGAGTRNTRSVFLDGHLQSKEDGRFILIEHGDNAPAIDDGNPTVEHVGHVAGFAVDRPEACRGNLLGKGLLVLFVYKPLLCEVGPVGVGVIIGRWTEMHRA